MSTSDDRQPQVSPDEHGLRDARLQRALAHAPDAHLRPDAAVRQAVLRAARDAVSPAAPAAAARQRPRWWAWLVGEEGRMPWNAALATVLIAGIVALLWHDPPVPPASPGADRPLPAAKPAPQALPAPDPVPAPAPSAAPSPAPAPAAAPQSQSQAQAHRRAAPAAPREERALSQREVIAAAPAPAAAAASPPPIASSTPEWADRWTSARVAPQAAPLARADAGTLPDLLARVPRAAMAGWMPSRSEERLQGQVVQERKAARMADAAPAPALRIELFEGDRPLGVVEITAGRARFLQAGGGESVFALDAAAEAALRAEAARLAR